MSSLRLYISAIVLALTALAAWLLPVLRHNASALLVIAAVFVVAQLVSCRERYRQLVNRPRRRGGRHVPA